METTTAFDEYSGVDESFFPINPFDNDTFVIKYLCHPQTRYALHLMFYIVLGLVGTIGNFLLLCVILGNRSLWKVVNSFIFNLSLANFLFIVFIVPIQIEQEINPCWLTSLISCKVKYFLPVVFQSAGIFSLVALSRERYVAIIGGLHPRNKPTHSKLSLVIVAVIWVLAVLCGLPLYWLASKPRTYMCIPYKTFGDTAARTYAICSIVFLYAIPLFIIAAQYIPIARLLLQSTNMQLSERRSPSSANNMARKRLAIVILIITGTFAFMWLPHFIYGVSYQFANSPENNFPQHLIYYMQVINACLDPWVVFIMSSSYRNYLVNCVTCSLIRKTFNKHGSTAPATTTIQQTSAQTISSRRISTKTMTTL